MAKIGFIGTGEIASALVDGLANQDHQIWVSPRSATRAKALSQKYEEVNIASNEAIVEQADIVFLCLMANIARTVLPTLNFREDQMVISVMVDVSHAELLELCNPASSIAICIPLASIAHGQSALPIFPDNAKLRELFGNNNIIACKDERALNAHFAASALASPILDQIRVGAAWLAEFTGDSEVAESYVATIFAGFMRDVLDNETIGFSDLLDSLATEGGLNASLRAHMANLDTIKSLISGLDALRPRLGLNF